MSINYQLFCRESYNKIIHNLDNIINIFEEIDACIKEETDLLKKDIVVSNQTHNKIFFTNKKENITFLRDKCDKKLMEICNHNFIEDSIDIDIDRSKNIRYCTICEYTDTNK